MSAELTSVFSPDQEIVCWLLKVGGISILLDCGWNKDTESLETYYELLPSVRYILISHPTLDYVGALPFLAKHPSFRAQVYTTYPVHRMSQMVMYELFLSSCEELALEDINHAWERIQTLKFSQKVHMKEKGIVFTPHRAGNNLGGAVWKITNNMQDILYAPCVNPHPSNHIQGLDFSSLENPSVLIMDSLHANETQTLPGEVLERITQTLHKGGSVLIPVEVVGTTLELLYMLELLWENNTEELGGFPLAFIGHVANSTIEFARSFLEWMSEEALARFEGARDNPFIFKYLKAYQDLEDLPPGPGVYLATPINVENGFSQKLFFQMVSKPLNLILFLSPPKGFSQTILSTSKDQNIQLEVQELQYGNYESHYRSPSEEQSTEISETNPIIEENEVQESFGPRLFETKQYPRFSVGEWKHDCDEYGESMVDEEMEFWQEEHTEATNTTITATTIKNYTQTVSFRLLEEVRRRRHAFKTSKSYSEVVRASCEYSLLDYRASSISIRLTLARLRPKKVLLINPKNSMSLINYAKNSLYLNDIQEMKEKCLLIPQMSVEPIKIAEEAYNDLKFLPVDGYEVAKIKGSVSLEEQQFTYKLDTSQEARPKGLFLGNLALGTLRDELKEKGFKVEFREGRLVINEKVEVSKGRKVNGVQEYTIEGVASQDFFEIRHLIYSTQLFV